MVVGLIAAILASLAYGTSSVLQAYGARQSAGAALGDLELGGGGPARVTASGAPTLRSTWAAVLTLAFIVGTVLDVLGFVGGAISARLAPLFLSQTVISANLVVTAVLGIFVLKIRLHMRDWLAIGTVLLALGALGLASESSGGGSSDPLIHWGLLVGTLAILGVSLGVVRLLGSRAAIAAGLSAGVLFGVVAMSVRVMHGVEPFNLGDLLRDPATWALAIAGVGGFYLHTVALQLGSVNGATAALVVGETVIPGAIGVWLLGDSAVPGLEWLAVLGFILAIGGAVCVAVFGAAEAVSADEHAASAKPNPVPDPA
ncbi:hypothetical protein [Tomitella biformata]|uniref:hypothetical protein n=1 Tax=Tomitella biformata TaxID=630403 RepID=UPI0004654321|nr:hypothetical protein [Tomitella biformata]